MRAIAGKLVFVCSLFAAAAAFAAGDQGQGAPPAGAGQGPGARGGGGGAAQPLQNIKVLPKDWSRQQVQQLMNTFVESLGVQTPAGEGCAFCHATDTSAPPPAAGRGPAMDWPSDSKPEKETARKMIQMTMMINADSLKGVGDAAAKEKVSCFSCHQGSKKPAMMPAAGWGRGNFTLIAPGPTVPQRGAAPGGAPGGAAPGRQ